MADYAQADRPMTVQTPLGKDVLLLVGFQGQESLSQLFQFQLDLIADNRVDVAFEKLIGQKVTVTLNLPDGQKRYFSGICNRLTQGRREATFTRYQMEIVPQFWLLTRTWQCRIFQHLSVPDILKKVLAGLDVKYEIQGTFQPRRYCVQYRETDFAFASRLMEEEGIYYYFKHAADGHQLVIANSPAGHAEVPGPKEAIYEEVKGGNRKDLRITDWLKTQELRTGKYSLWDHNFEMPRKKLEAEKTIQDSVAVGTVTHKLKVGGNDKLEIYDYPGAYAQRFDGIDRGGAAKPSDLHKIFDDNVRTVGLRMQEEALHSIEIRGASNCGQFTAGHKFTLERHFNADGQYVLTRVEHTAKQVANYRTGDGEELVYENRFQVIPVGLPYRPPLTTPKPVIAGTQTATVVGPPGETIFPDKYGRVKVQFHWDRHGKMNADSSCWIRVSQNWGGGDWGGMFIPHVGHEVIVSFEEGDVDRPIITGRVYNAEKMPPLGLPNNKTKSVIRDHGGNQVILEGHGGVQQMLLHSPHSKTTLTLGAPFPAQVPALAGSGNGAGPQGPTVQDAVAAANQAETDAKQAETDAKTAQKTADQAETDAKAAQTAAATAQAAANQAVAFTAGFGLTTGANWTETVAGYENITIGDYSIKDIKNDCTHNVHGNFIETIDHTCHITVTEKATYDYLDDLEINITGKKHEKVKSDHWYTFAGSSHKNILGVESKYVVGGTNTIIAPGAKHELIVGISVAELGGMEVKYFKAARAEIGSNKKVTKFTDIFSKEAGGLFNKSTWVKTKAGGEVELTAADIHEKATNSYILDSPKVEFHGTEHVKVKTPSFDMSASDKISFKTGKMDVNNGVMTIGG